MCVGVCVHAVSYCLRCVSAYCCACARILLDMRPQTMMQVSYTNPLLPASVCVLDVRYVSSDEHRCRSRWLRRERSLSRALLPGQDDSFGLSDSDLQIGAF